ncbi:hypothetical protein CAJAP_07088 [Camponotus japonicus]
MMTRLLCSTAQFESLNGCFDNNNAHERRLLHKRKDRSDCKDSLARGTFNTTPKLKSTFTTLNLLLSAFSADKRISL